MDGHPSDGSFKGYAQLLQLGMDPGAVQMRVADLLQHQGLLVHDLERVSQHFLGLILRDHKHTVSVAADDIAGQTTCPPTATG